MLRKCALILAASALATFSNASLPTEVGTAFCFGTQCPCGNVDPTGGCANSTGRGGRLTATGSTRIAADDLVYRATHLPPNKVALLVVSPNQRSVAFGDGRLCVGPGMARLRKHFNTGCDGEVNVTGVIDVLSDRGISVRSGETWHAQLWFRDPDPKFGCKANATTDKTNLTNAYSVTFTP